MPKAQSRLTLCENSLWFGLGDNLLRDRVPGSTQENIKKKLMGERSESANVLRSNLSLTLGLIVIVWPHWPGWHRFESRRFQKAKKITFGVIPWMLMSFERGELFRPPQSLWPLWVWSLMLSAGARCRAYGEWAGLWIHLTLPSMSLLNVRLRLYRSDTSWSLGTVAYWWGLKWRMTYVESCRTGIGSLRFPARHLCIAALFLLTISSPKSWSFWLIRPAQTSTKLFHHGLRLRCSPQNSKSHKCL